ncbi:MAG: hypothetical protein V4736_08615 [Bdellovibrionota bacterium]
MGNLTQAFFFDEPADLDYFLATFPNTSLEFVPLNYKSFLYASGKGLSTFNYYDFVQSEEYDRYKNLSEARIDDLREILNDFSASKDSDVHLGDYFFFHLQIVWGMLQLKSYFLKVILDKKKYSTISFLRKSDSGELLYGFRPRFENLSLEIAKTIFTGTITEIHKPENPVVSKGGFKSVLSKMLYRGPFWIYHSWANQKQPLQQSSGSAEVAFLGPLYDWKGLLPEISRKAKVRFYHQEFFPNHSCHLQDELVLHFQNNPDILKWLGADFLPLLKSQIKIMGSTLDFIISKKKKYIGEISRLKLILTTVTPYPLQGFFAHMAKRAGKKIIYFQHGEKELVQGDPTTLSTEALFGSAYLSWGKKVSEAYKQFNFDTLLTVGSIRIYELFHNLGTAGIHGKSILYATGKFLSDSHYFIGRYGSDQRLADSQLELYKYFSTLKGEKILFRPNTTLHFDTMAADFFALPNVVACKKTFTEALPDAKLIILDAPATTCVEACATNLPLFILMNRANWSEEALKALKKRAIVETNIESLIEKLNRYLLEGRYEADVENTDFLLGYGLAGIDINPKDEVLKYIDKALKS